MAHGHDSFDDSSDDLDRFGSDESAEMICPECRKAVSEEAVKCPHCDEWMTPVDPDSGGIRRWVYVLAVLVMLLISLMWAL